MAKLEYITFDQLMASVESDLPTHADNALINRGAYIKVIRKINASIGLKINQERERVLEIKNYKVDLPEDFMTLQLALACGQVQQYALTGAVLGTHTEEHNEERVLSCKDRDSVCLNSHGGTYWVTQTFKEKTTKHTSLIPVAVSNRSLKFCSNNCLNFKFPKSGYEIDVDENQIVTNFREGKLYINYLSDMLDEEGNVIVLDHPLITPYYEYAVKKQIFENMYLNNADDNLIGRWKLLKGELQEAKFEALNFVNTPEYTDIQDMYQANRKRFYNKYHRMFYDYQYQ